MNNVLKVSPSNRRTITLIEEGWKCQYCNKTYTHEKSFMKHKCPKKEKLEELKTPIGQAAYINYSDWMKHKKRSVPPIETFSNSIKYRAFIKFTTYAINLNITASVFVKLMANLDIDPVLWCIDATYSEYLNHYDKFHDPGEQVVNSLEFLKVLAEKENAEFVNIFNHMGFRRFLEFVRLRKISPWLIFNCDSCSDFMSSLDQEDLCLLSDIVRGSVWGDKLGDNREDCLLLQELITEYGL